MNSKKVLIVEDDKFIKSLIASKLSSKGFTITTTDSGMEALKMAEKDVPDIILLDILLPEMGGFEVLEKLKSNPITKNASVIIFSNLGQQSDLEKAYKLGASKFLVKANTTPNEIASEIETQLNLKVPQEHSQS